MKNAIEQCVKCGCAHQSPEDQEPEFSSFVYRAFCNESRNQCHKANCVPPENQLASAKTSLEHFRCTTHDRKTKRCKQHEKKAFIFWIDLHADISLKFKV